MKTNEYNQTSLNTPRIVTCLFFLLSGILFATSTGLGQSLPDNHIPGLIHVKFKPEIVPSRAQSLSLQGKAIAEARSLLNSRGFREGRKTFRHFEAKDTLAVSRRTGKQVQLRDLSLWYTIKVADSVNTFELADKLMKLSGIEVASPGFAMQTHGIFPNDPRFQSGLQWGLHNFSSPGKDIHAPDAWAKNKGRNDVIVAVLDGGVDYNHSDLDPGNRSRIIQGHDVADNDGNPMDDISSGKAFANHGTAVAGIIGAITNNSSKVAGVMWNVKIMPVKVAWTSGPWWDPFGWTMGGASNGNVAESVDYARQNGADIINMSLGGDGVSGKWYSTFINNPVTEATYNAYQQDILVIAAMGNDGQEKEQYPAAFPWVMAIGASTQNDSRASFSNSGNHIDVVAPGVNYYTTYRNNSDGSFGGTSASTPVTSGVAGLILSESKDLGLNLTNDDIRHIIQLTADKVPGMQGQNFHKEYGYGRVNADEALKLINPPNIVEHSTKTGGSSTLTWGSHTHTFFRGMGTLAAGTYYGVKQYKVTGFASFSNYFTSIPKVWIRERTTKGWSGANPNLEVPWVNITNVTNSGFYYETFVYWIGSNSAGVPINAYYPESPSQAKIAYTAVGVPGTSPPAAPTNLAITNAGSMGSPILNWDDNSEPDLDYYKVFRTKKRLSDGYIYSPVHIASPSK